MASYNVALAASAHKELRHLPRHEISRIHQRIVDLATSPRPHGVQKLSGAKDEYRLRQGDYRIVYHVDDVTREVTILRIRHRKDAYRWSA